MRTAIGYPTVVFSAGMGGSACMDRLRHACDIAMAFVETVRNKLTILGLGITHIHI